MLSKQQIREGLDAKGWTQDQLSEATDLSRDTINRAVRGDLMTTKTYRKIGTALGIYSRPDADVQLKQRIVVSIEIPEGEELSMEEVTRIKSSWVSIGRNMLKAYLEARAGGRDVIIKTEWNGKPES